MVTPCVLRPAMRMSPTVVRIILPWSVTSISCSPGLTGKLATTPPLRSRGDDVDDALAAAVGAAIFIGRRALAIAIFGDGQEELLLLRDLGVALVAQVPSAQSVAAPLGRFQIGLALLLRGAGAAQDRHGDDLVVAEQADAADAGRGARLEFANVGRLEADRLAVAGGEQDVVLLGQQLDPDQPVAEVGLLLAFVAIVRSSTARSRTASRSCRRSGCW